MTSQPLIRHVEDESSIEQLAHKLRTSLPWFHNIPADSLLDLLNAYSEKLVADTKATQLEGIAYLVFWLRRENLERLIQLNLTAGKKALDEFVEIHGATVRAQPAGLVCHWVAGNVPTLPIFSWILSVIVKNVSLIRVSANTLDATEALIGVLHDCTVPGLSGQQLLQQASFVHFDHEHSHLHRAMSLVADCKVIWGGADAVQQITSLPRMDHCNEIVFGPKYSTGVLSRCTIEDESVLQDSIRNFVRDIILFDQRACSSPQTIFFESGRRPATEIMERFQQSFLRVAESFPKREIDPFTAVQIYSTRAEWGLSEARDFRASLGADWTVCLDHETSFKTAVQSRCIFLSEIADLMDIVPLMSPKIQTIGTAIQDPVRFLQFADAVTLKGVSRCVRPGLMNAYDLPWDGKMVLSEMVRWVSIKR